MPYQLLLMPIWQNRSQFPAQNSNTNSACEYKKNQEGGILIAIKIIKIHLLCQRPQNSNYYDILFIDFYKQTQMFQL